MPPEKHFLVWRDNGGLRRIEVYDADMQDIALKEYKLAEWRILVMQEGKQRGLEVVLFGSDSLATLCKTHASWFASETLSLDALEAHLDA